ncbi:MAG: twin-arginine translocase subunit TatC, partial [Deltaproteobacteria bacterium]
MEEKRLSFTEHLEELRARLIKSAIALGIGFVICYIYSKQLFNILLMPLTRVLPKGSSMVFISLTEPFFTYLKVAFLAGLFLSSPFIFYQLWKFVSPGLYTKEKKYVIPFVLLSTIFFVGGACFGYFVVFPYGFKFFLGLATKNIRPFPSIRDYLSFSSKLLIAFGLIFEIPLITFFLAKIGLITSTFLSSKRRYAILVMFVLAAIFTPPDIVTQLMMALPLMLLFEASVIVAKIFGRKPEEEKKEEKDKGKKKKKEK